MPNKLDTRRNLERVKGLSESNITTMDNALLEIESNFKKNRTDVRLD